MRQRWARLTRAWRVASAVSFVAGLSVAGAGAYDLLAGSDAEVQTGGAPRDRLGDTASPTGTDCVDPARFSFERPSGWHARGLTDGTQPCRFLHPDPFEVPEATELVVAVSVVPEPVPFDEAVAVATEPDFVFVHERVDRQVGGRRVTTLLAESTDEITGPGGLLYQAIVEAPSGIVSIFASSTAAPDFDEAKAVVDRAVETLEFT